MLLVGNKRSLSPSPRALGAIACVLMAGLWLAAPPCTALGARSAGDRWLAQSAADMSAEEAAALVRSTSGGRILGVRRVDTARGPAYHVKVLLDGGRVRTYVVDAGSGEILR